MFSSKSLLFLIILYAVEADVTRRYYPKYHLAPPYGWMNDPNGFCVFRNEYHLFYQYNPFSSLEAGTAHWGHAKSRDLVNWEHLPIAMYPDEWYDKQGVFSGSALVENDTMYLFFTGNLNHPNNSPDHEQHQAMAISTDGLNVTKYEKNPIVMSNDRQPNFRDPKVWKHENMYYMVLGNSFKNGTLGRVLLYASSDIRTWEEVSILGESDDSLGYMWECPDFFELNSSSILLFSPQGIEPQGDKYRNLYQTGYFVGSFNYTTHNYTILSNFRELDHGHDFYATQSIMDAEGRRIVIAWFDMWEAYYPERKDGFTGLLTIPRELFLTANGHLLQKPVKQIDAARDRIIFAGKPKAGTVVTLEDNAGEINVKVPAGNYFQLLIESDNDKSLVTLTYTSGYVTLDRGGSDGVRRTNWNPSNELKWRIFIDASSIELFCGEGEVTFSSRFFPQGTVRIRVTNDTLPNSMIVYSIKRTVPLPK